MIRLFGIGILAGLLILAGGQVLGATEGLAPSALGLTLVLGGLAGLMLVADAAVRPWIVWAEGRLGAAVLVNVAFIVIGNMVMLAALELAPPARLAFGGLGLAIMNVGILRLAILAFSDSAVFAEPEAGEPAPSGAEATAS